MSSLPKTFLSEAEYLEHERRAEYKSEYYRGEVFAMAGASRWHAWIVANLVRELGQQLKGKACRVSASDLRVKVSSTGLYTYPDVVVACGKPQFSEESDTLLNSSVIIEVLSDSTTDYDHGRKFQQYRTLPSLTDYLMVDQHTPHVEHYTREADRWVLAEFSDLAQSVPLASLDCVLPLPEIYYQIEFPQPPSVV